MAFIALVVVMFAASGSVWAHGPQKKRPSGPPVHTRAGRLCLCQRIPTIYLPAQMKYAQIKNRGPEDWGLVNTGRNLSLRNFNSSWNAGFIC